MSKRKLTTEQASEIIVKYIETGVLIKELAEEYNVSYKTIRRIINGFTYREATKYLVETAKEAAKIKSNNADKMLEAK